MGTFLLLGVPRSLTVKLTKKFECHIADVIGHSEVVKESHYFQADRVTFLLLSVPLF